MYHYLIVASVLCTLCLPSLGNPVEEPMKRNVCPEPQMCLSQWGYCGYGDQYCGAGCQGGACGGSGSGSGGAGTFSGHGTYYDGK